MPQLLHIRSREWRLPLLLCACRSYAIALPRTPCLLGGGPPNVITGNSSSISSFSSNSELAILQEYHYPTILMTTLQPYSPYPRYGGSALTVVIVL